MNADQSPIVNKLILVVLSLILVCLVLLVIRAYDRDTDPGQAATIAEETPAIETTPPVADTPPTRPVAKRTSVTNSTRLAAAVQPSPQETPPPTLAEQEAAAPPPVAQGLYLPGGSTGRSGGTRGDVGGRPPSGTPPGIYGIVSLVGTPRPEIQIDLGPSCGRLRNEPVTTRHFVVSPEGRLANVFVFLSQGVSNRFAPITPSPLLDQVGCMFEPYVLAVQAGQPFFIRNSDPELHNVHATPKLNKEFNFAQVSGGAIIEKVFAKPELAVRLKCDVHPWMFAYIGVFDHPFFAVTDTNGVFSLPVGFPPGRYTVTASHLRAGALSQEVLVGPGEQKGIAFQLPVSANATPQSQAVVTQ